MWGIKKIYSLQAELEQETLRHLNSITNIQKESEVKYNKLLNLKNLDTLYQQALQLNKKPEEEIREKIKPELIIEAEELLPPPPPFEDFQNSVKEINKNIKEITDSTGIKDDLTTALKQTKNSSQNDVEQAVRAVFQKYPLIKKTDPALLISMAKKAALQNLSNSALDVNTSIMTNNLPEAQIISIAQSLQQNKTIELTGDFAGKEDQVKLCIQKIARFIIRFFSSQTLTNDIEKTAQKQKIDLNLASFNKTAHVHLKTLPPLPSKDKNLTSELKKKVASRPVLKSHELEELDKKTSLEKIEQVKKDLLHKEHDKNTSVLGQLENFNKGRLKKVIKEEVVQKETNPLFSELLNKFKNANVEDENEDSDDEDQSVYQTGSL